MAHSRKHRHVGRTVGESAGLRQINAFLIGILANAPCFFILRQERRQHPAGGDVVLELQAVTNHFFETEVERYGPDGKVQGSCNKYVAIAKIAGRIDERLSLREDRWLQSDLEKIVGQADQAIPMHPAIGSKRENIEKRARIQIQPKKQGNAQ